MLRAVFLGCACIALWCLPSSSALVSILYVDSLLQVPPVLRQHHHTLYGRQSSASHTSVQVWAVNLALYSLHIGGSSRVGEPWSSPESWVQLAGFVLLLAGTIIYAQVPFELHPHAHGAAGRLCAAAGGDHHLRPGACSVCLHMPASSCLRPCVVMRI